MEFYLLQQNGDLLLLESGDYIILGGSFDIGAGETRRERELYFKRNLDSVSRKKKEIDRLKMEYFKKLT